MPKFKDILDKKIDRIELLIQIDNKIFNLYNGLRIKEFRAVPLRLSISKIYGSTNAINAQELKKKNKTLYITATKLENE